jgi:hypothetical protein
MSRSPIAAFAALDAALTRGCALLAMAHANPDAMDAVVPRLEDVMVEVFDAWSHLLARPEVIPEIRAFLLATYGGQPG